MSNKQWAMTERAGNHQGVGKTPLSVSIQLRSPACRLAGARLIKLDSRSAGTGRFALLNPDF